MFYHKFETLTDKLINTTNKDENQIIINSINKNKDKLFEKYEYDDWVIQSSNWRINLIDTVKHILKFNEEFNYKTKNENEDNEYENENEDNENENENDDETMSQNEQKEIIKRLNDHFGKIIDLELHNLRHS